MNRRATGIGVAAAMVVLALIATGVVVLLSTGDDQQEAATEPPPTTRAPIHTPTPTPTPEREPTTAAAVTSHPDATQAAMDVMDEGGSAVDAAFAAAAVLSVVEPYYSSVIAGETSALYYDGETGEIQSLEAVGFVGSEFDLGGYQSRGAAGYGLYQALVPAAWDGWMTLLEAEGELDVDRLLAPAIALARDGYPATAEASSHAARLLGYGSVNGAARAIYAPDGSAVAPGAHIVQSDFAASLQGIADVAAATADRESGIDAARAEVYTGELGQRLLAVAREGGATFTAEDMATVEASLNEPITLDYAGYTVYQNPPTSQGVTMLAALNTLRTAGLSPENADSPETAHTMIEAMKLAMADREAYVGDPAFVDVPVDELLDPGYGERQLARIDPGSSAYWPIGPGLEENTTTFQILDADGNAITVTTSTGYQLVAAGDTGVMMNNRMRFMTASDPASPNFLEPGKMVRYTGNPYMVTGDDGLRLFGGNVGGDSQSQVQMQHVVNVLDFGLSAPEAVARHRFVGQAHPNSVVPHGVPNRVMVENTMPQAMIDGLRQRGQNIEVQTMGAEPFPFGFGSMIELLEGGQEVVLGPDPRIEAPAGQTRAPEDAPPPR